ncbi:ribonuclease H-like domain-containing protein [Rhizophagus irregularis DAOM 181602=DAOM 197198]|nr:ribonuclease H-like domain-containing protein [Rhizophagus irregularis DAOM 181602=DAOM 197198]
MVSTRIEALTFKQELTNIRHQLKSLKNIEYYTDGSLANWTIDNNNLLYRADNTTVDLGTAFYTSNELGEFSVYSCLSLWPSSTRAEIVAIFLALLTAPENSNVTIYTDSLGAINSINSAFNSTTRTWLKKTNNLIIIKIIMLIREASINLKLIKIKGHSGIIGNDIADKLAKKGQYKPIEVNIRRFILKILATGEATEWSLLKNNQELCYGDVNQIDWKITWLISIIARGSILAIRKPKLYKEMKCIMKCNKKENWNHLFECQAYEVAWQKILEITTKESIIICLKQKQIRSQGKDFIKKVLQNILGITAKSEKFQKFQQLALEISLTEAQTLMANMLIRFILAFKELIWKPRCEQVILWEKREEFKVKDNSNQLTNKAKDLKMGKVDQLQKTVSLVKKSMDTFVRKYICEDWILIKKKVDKITLYMSEKLLD